VRAYTILLGIGIALLVSAWLLLQSSALPSMAWGHNTEKVFEDEYVRCYSDGYIGDYQCVRK